MQAGGSALPELELHRDEPVTTPPWGTRDLAIAEPSGHLGQFGFKFSTVRDHGRLGGRPRPKLAAARAGRKVAIRFVVGQLDHFASHADLPLHSEPGKHCGRSGVVRELGALAAVPVGIEIEPSFRKSAHQQVSCGGNPSGADGAQDHRVRLRHACRQRIADPAFELPVGSRVDVGFVQRGVFIVGSQLGEIQQNAPVVAAPIVARPVDRCPLRISQPRRTGQNETVEQATEHEPAELATPNRGVAAPLSLGRHEVWPPVVLAPMAGVTDAAFRTICWRQGAPLCVSEMLTARAIVERHEPTMKMIPHHPEERIRSIQLYSTDPVWLGEAVRYLVGVGVEHIDLNFGCPAPKVTRLGGGAAIPFKRRLFRAMIRSAVNAAGSAPVTVKFRIGIDDDHHTFLDAGRIAADEGVAWVALHARTAEQLYAPPAHWEFIAQLVDAVEVPVLGNGDVWAAEDATKMMAETGCAGVVIGRGCLGRPQLFRELVDTFDGGQPGEPPTLGVLAETVLEHARLLVSLRDETRIPSFRKHLAWYLKGYPVGGDTRRAASAVETLADIEALLTALPADAELPPENRRLARSHTGGPRPVTLPERWLDDPDEDVALPRGAEALASGG